MSRMTDQRFRADVERLAARLSGLDATVPIRIPDSAAAQAAEELSREVSAPALYAHSVRSYAFAALLARHDGVRHDEELLYVACLLHDLGLSPPYDDPVRPFEQVSAGAARTFASSLGWPGERSDRLQRAIVLHMALEVSAAEAPEVLLLAAGVSCDVSGTRIEDVDRRARDELLRQFPRGRFKAEFSGLMRTEAERKPGCAADVLIRRGLLERIATAPFADATDEKGDVA